MLKQFRDCVDRAIIPFLVSTKKKLLAIFPRRS
jgi:hypothetical protein